MKFRPLHDRVVVKRIDAEEKTAGGIIIPDTAKEKPSQGEITAVGPGGRDESGKLIPIDLKVGDRVLFGKWSGNEVKLDGQELLIMKESDISVALHLVQESKLRALAVASLKRSPSAPNLPTMSEAGFPGFDVTAWFGLMAPAGTPESIIDRRSRETVRVLALPDLRKKFDELGIETIGNSPAEFAAAIHVETMRWGKGGMY
jgi:chaperonin GroES